MKIFIHSHSLVISQMNPRTLIHSIQWFDMFMKFRWEKVKSLLHFPVHLCTEDKDIFCCALNMACLLLQNLPCKYLSQSLSLSFSFSFFLSLDYNVLDSCVRRVVLTLPYLQLKPQLCIYTFNARLFSFSIIG